MKKLLSNNFINPPFFGVHLSTAEGLDGIFRESRRLKINVFQIFLGSPRVWKPKNYSLEEKKYFKERLKNFYFVCVHAPYLLNFASNNKELFKKSMERAILDMNEMKEMGIKHYVFHPGTNGDLDEGICLIKEALEKILDATKEVIVLVENTAGEKNDIGKNMDELMRIVKDFDDRVGICLDTCHLFASGVDIRSFDDVDCLYAELKRLSLHERLKVIHANDSKFGFNGKRDRHEHIDFGNIGKKGFLNLFKHPYFRCKPYILETPKEDNMDYHNLLTMRKIWAET